MILLQDAFWSALAALGFAMLFNVPRRTLLYCVIGGAIGHALRTLFIARFDLGVELATLLAATAVGFWAWALAQYLQMPSMIFGITAAIPMVPGVYAYKTMIGILQIAVVPADEVSLVLVSASVNAIKSGLILAALAVGIVAPTLLFRRHRPVV